MIQLKLMADRAAIDTARIGDLINSFLASPQVAEMLKADQYYMARHDILDYVPTYWVDETEETDLAAANNLVPNPFLSILIDQKVAKVVGKPISVTVSGANAKDKDQVNAEADKFQTLLSKQLDVYFNDKMQDWVAGASKHITEWMHFYVNTQGELKYIICPSNQVIPIYDMQYEDKLIYAIRFYQYDLINEKSQTQKAYKLEWWTKKDVTYWVQIENSSFILDTSYIVNPTPHWFAANDTLGTKEPHGWGRVPFVGLQNNSKCQNDLHAIKALIDAYDKVYCGWCNDIEDFAEQILVVHDLAIGAKDRELHKGITELALTRKNLKRHGMLMVEGDKGGVDSLKTDIPVEAKKQFLEITRKAIFYFGEGVDVTDEKFGNAPSGVALQHIYALLEAKADRTILKMKYALKDFFWFITQFINNTNSSAFDSEMIMTAFNTSQIFNKKEVIDGNMARKGFLSDETLLGLDPDVNDVAEEMDRLEKQRAKTAVIEAAKIQQQIDPATGMPMKGIMPAQEVAN